MIEVDARGLLCPLPVLRLRKVLLAQPPGSAVALIATDRMAAIDVPHFCAEGGHELLHTADLDDGATRFEVRRGG
ncbi:MAG: sulfurtransferase TusA family protein [Paracoccus sp. (in: a-proteobacteria)]|nr:sulfurtransferase TusA family protein [Paracoccus sp. (in: a-proteobacteria)]